MTRRLVVTALASMWLATACSAPPAMTDSGAMDAATDIFAESGMPDSPQCRSDMDCSDGVFCNGAERCTPMATGADPRGCVAASPANPCSAPQTCNEAMDRCDGACDADGDMHDARSCGGDDCDDTDRNVHPGAMEICDTANRDEDCDPSTLGFRDNDMDSYSDARCCNTASDGMMHCGDDCNDGRPNVHPGLAEVCDGFDNDCNGIVDEGVQRTFYPDADGDGFGNSAGTPMTGCNVPAGYTETRGDCNDTNAAIHPGAVELCDAAMVDEDCDGSANTSCSCTGAASRMCAGALGACAAGVQTCVSGMWSACSVAPQTEACNGIDDDCDGVTDNGVTIQCYADGDGDGYAPSGTAAAPRCPDSTRPMTGGCPAGSTNRMPDATNADCNDALATTNPGAAESCNTMDDNCNGAIDEGVQTTLYVDADGDGYGSTATLGCAGTPGLTSTPGDCYDSATDSSAVDVHPGQSLWFTMRDGRGSFDYNCSGALEQERATAACGTSGTSCTATTCHAGLPPSVTCGTTVTTIVCRCDTLMRSCQNNPDASAPVVVACH